MCYLVDPLLSYLKADTLFYNVYQLIIESSDVVTRISCITNTICMVTMDFKGRSPGKGHNRFSALPPIILRNTEVDAQ